METYTSGKWTVSSLVKDTLKTPKTLSVIDLDYNVDYARQKLDDESAVIINTTGESIGSPESIRYACSSVNDVYANTSVDKINKFASTKGMQVLCEVKTTYRGTNSVTGQEVDVPITGRIVLRVPSFTFVTDDLVKDALNRTVAAALNTGKTDASRIVELLRGSTLPDGL